MDSGSTTAALIKQLNRKQGLVVMTNSLSVATALRSLENEPTLLMTGGTWDTRSESFQAILPSKCYVLMILTNYLLVPMALI